MTMSISERLRKRKRHSPCEAHPGGEAAKAGAAHSARRVRTVGIRTPPGVARGAVSIGGSRGEALRDSGPRGTICIGQAIAWSLGTSSSLIAATARRGTRMHAKDDADKAEVLAMSCVK